MNTYETAHRFLNRFEGSEDALPRPNIDINFHEVSPEAAKEIVKGFPELRWDAHAAGPTEWLTGGRDGVALVIFLTTPGERRPERGLDILKEVARGA